MNKLTIVIEQKSAKELPRYSMRGNKGLMPILVPWGNSFVQYKREVLPLSVRVIHDFLTDTQKDIMLRDEEEKATFKVKFEITPQNVNVTSKGNLYNIMCGLIEMYHNNEKFRTMVDKIEPPKPYTIVEEESIDELEDLVKEIENDKDLKAIVFDEMKDVK